ncbi:hypothetical protein KGQ27_03650 [Patescibacteria group bacterium]|nr:hypothetical protein [Patescibacteria group bacterium]MDE1946935.1 hypothetical protein [Patescibacteria group bacterium]MDE2011196.1 hypothetical protein [Patescibacteria group bacterium]MDE2233486.1 hypothetical protein [Patescibacteria group bacterium]
MKATVKKQKTKGQSVITIKDEGRPVSGAHVLLLADNNTFFEGNTGTDGTYIFRDLQIKSYSVYVAHPLYPGYVIDGFVPDSDLDIDIKKEGDVGSLICASRTGYIPGLDGRLNPILDTSNRTYLYADNIAIDGGKNQPVTFDIGKQITLEDRSGAVFAVVFLRIKGDSSILQYRKIITDNIAQPEGRITGLIIEAGGNISNSGEILANKDQYIILRSAKNIIHSGKIDTSGNPNHKVGLLERLTNNQTAAIVIGGLILAAVIYIIYRYSGINLHT